VLDDRADRAVVGVELRHQLERRVGVVDVVVAQLLALVLGGGGHAGAAGAVEVEGRGLVRVLAVAQRLASVPAKARRRGVASPVAFAIQVETAAS
jgi:hypothetical protein